MKMKKYNAPSISAAMKMIRADLGEDAVILNSKVVVNKKFLGLIKNRSYEVVAGFDRVEKGSAMPSLPNIPSIPTTLVEEPINMSYQQVNQPVEPEKVPQAAPSDSIAKEIADLKSMIQAMQRSHQ